MGWVGLVLVLCSVSQFGLGRPLRCVRTHSAQAHITNPLAGPLLQQSARAAASASASVFGARTGSATPSPRCPRPHLNILVTRLRQLAVRPGPRKGKEDGGGLQKKQDM